VSAQSTSISHNNHWHSLFNPGSIAVIGANETVGSWGSDAIKAALAVVKADPTRRAYPVNPNQKQIFGATSYNNVLAIPDPVDLAIIAVRADLVPGVMQQCVQKGVKAAVIISAGVGEVDEAGAKLEAEVVCVANHGGIRFIGPNCIGHANVHIGVSCLGMAEWLKPGPMALVSQSGTMSASIMRGMMSRGIGISKFASTGNEADLRLVDYLEYLANDDETKIIGAYVEGIREGQRFFRLAKDITMRKPIVLIKTGGTEGAVRAARSHTSALAGSDTVLAAVFKQTGIIRVSDEEELCNVILSLLSQPLPRGNHIGILTIGGGFGVMAAEACEREGLVIAPLQPRTISKLNEILPSRWSHGNPVDMVGVKTANEFEMIHASLRAMIEDENLDAVLALITKRNYSGEEFRAIQEQNERALKEIGHMANEIGKPVLLVRHSLPQTTVTTTSPFISYEDKLPEYNKPQEVARVLGHLIRYRHYLDSRSS
jgi:acyl-CoA synthetase (NDP forming)